MCVCVQVPVGSLGLSQRSADPDEDAFRVSEHPAAVQRQPDPLRQRHRLHLLLLLQREGETHAHTHTHARTHTQSFDQIIDPLAPDETDLRKEPRPS